MTKTLLQPKKHTGSDQLKVKRTDENTSLEELTEEMQPYLENAAKQLLQPDPEIVTQLLKKALR